ncbi:hypothetical protein BN77_3293 [Rhizobium mesoamericanum STM3625]|uniref:Uncharacterized protein n=1 Tax=Rhizobium mesoamericanum STM3625 TaxID=1211777 RepID=K0PXM6_9HYPH|nr:hypothetical protein BN77_3293 [Rhizobium mesoamericanum STM3625]
MVDVLHRAISNLALLVTSVMYPPYVCGMQVCMLPYPRRFRLHCDTSPYLNRLSRLPMH